MNASLRPRTAGIVVVLFLSALSSLIVVRADQQAVPAPALDRALRAGKLDDARRLMPEDWPAAEQLFVSYLERAYVPTDPSRPDAEARARAERWAEVHFRIVEYDFAKAVLSALETADASNRALIITAAADYFSTLERLRAASRLTSQNVGTGTPLASGELADPARDRLEQRRGGELKVALGQLLEVADRFRVLAIPRAQFWTLWTTEGLEGWPGSRDKVVVALGDELGDDLSLLLKRPFTEASLAMAERLGTPLRQATILESLAGEITRPDRSRPATPSELEQAASYLERARFVRRAVPSIESVNGYRSQFPAPASARSTLPLLWAVYMKLNRPADAAPLIAEALDVSRPFGDQALVATLSAFVVRTLYAPLDPGAQQAILDASRVLGPDMELRIARQACGGASHTECGDKALALAVALPNEHERAVTLEWYSRQREERQFQLLMNPGRYTRAQVDAIGMNPFPRAWNDLVSLCLKSDEVGLTVDALGSQAVFQASTGHWPEAVTTFNQAIEHAQRAGDLRKVAQTANRAAAVFPGKQSSATDVLALANRAVTAATAADDALQLAKGLRVRALLSIGATNDSFRDLQEAALAAARYTAQSGDATEEVRCLNALGNEHGLRGDYRLAVDVLEQAANKANGMPWSASARSMLPRIYQEIAKLHATKLGEPSLALAATERFSEFLMSSPNPNVRGSNQGLASLYRSVGRPIAALDAYAKALAPLQGTSTWLPNQRTMLTERAQLLTELGDYDAALADWDQVLALIPDTVPNFYRGSEPVQRAAWFAEVGRIHALTGNPEKALSLAREAVAEFARDAVGGTGRVFNSIVDILLATGHPVEAIAFCDRYIENVRLRSAVSNPVVERAYLERVARAHVSAGQFDRARSLLLSAADIDRHHPTAEVGGLAGSLLALGKLEAAAGNHAKAHEYLTSASEAVDAFDLDRIWQIERALAASLARAGDRRRADAHYERALTALETQHEQLRPEEFRFRYGEERGAIYTEHAQLLAGLAITTGEPHDALRAYQASERKRTQTLAALLATGWSRLNPEAVPDQVRRVSEMDSRMAAKRLLLLEQFAQTTDKRDEALVTELRSDLTRLQDEYARLLSSVAQGQYRYAAPTQLSSSLAPSVQAALGPSRTLVEYLVTDERTYAFVVSPTKITVVPLAIGRQELRQKIERLTGPFRQLRSGEVDLSRLDFDTATAYALFQVLFEPVQQAIGETTHVLIVPDDVLHGLPFDMLIDHAPGRLERSAVLHQELADLPFLVRRYTIGYLTSSAQLLTPAATGKTAAPKQLLAMANPSGSRPVPPSGYEDPLARQLRSGSLSGMLTAVPGADAEVQRIARHFAAGAATVVTGPSATEAFYRSQAGQYRILHFATHGVPSDSQPFYSTLVLAPDAAAGEDGFLQAYEVLRTPLDAELVVLSACETAIGSSNEGQGLTGLVAAFEQAGARSVLATSWSIDEAASDVMESFYRALAGGMSAPAALRQAKLDLLGRRIQVAGVDVSLVHPFFWAPFRLMGGGLGLSSGSDAHAAR